MEKSGVLRTNPPPIRFLAATYVRWLLLIALLGGVLLTRLDSYLLFHSIAEIFSAVVAFGVFTVAWNSVSFVKNSYLLILGVGSLFVAGIGILHTLAFKGMGVFPEPGANLPTQLWVAGRYFQALILLGAPFFLRRKIHKFVTLTVLGGITALLLVTIFVWPIFPTAYVDGAGLTPFKIASEYVIIALMAAATGVLWTRRAEFDASVLKWLVGSNVAAILAEFSFTLYIGVTDFANLLGHVFMIVEYYLLYRALVETGFTRPYKLIFRHVLQDKEALEDLQSSVTSTFDAISELVSIHDKNYRIVRVNKALAETFGKKPEELVGLPCYQVFHNSDKPWPNCPHTQAMQLKRAVTEEVLDPHIGCPLQVSVSPLFDKNGRMVGGVHIAKDITERKQAEEKILKLNQELEQRVRERTAELEFANKELDAFAHSVSHDLRTPLRHINGYIEIMQRSAAKIDPECVHYMEIVSQSAQQMGVLIDDLLSFSRLGRNEMYKTPVDLGKLVGDVIAEYRPEMENRTVEWKIAELPTVTGDRAMLRVVLVNLISNALKFTQPRPIARIEIGCTPSPDGGETVFFVRDNGVGFNMDYAEKLFKVFQRLHSSEEFEGTGIGLANVRRVITRHGGRTWAESKEGEGATFYFSLPNK